MLGVDLKNVRRSDPTRFGRILENSVVSELIRQLSVFGDGVLYHFRTHQDQEIDFIIERRN